MKAFEYSFNPQTSGYFFDSFAFEPESAHEKSIGSLYMLGILSKARENDDFFLSNLAKKIRESLYQSKAKDAEKALNESLQAGNQYLEQLVKTDCSNWISNLGFAVLGIKNRSVNFTKTGPVRIFLLRQGGVIDLEEGIDFPEMETCPMRVFGNLATGKLEDGDAIMVATSEIAEFLAAKKITSDIAAVAAPEEINEKIDEKKLESLFNASGKELGHIPGACLIVSLRKAEERQPIASFIPKPNLKKTALRDAFKPTALATPSMNGKKLSLPPVPKVPLLKAGVLVLVLGAVAAAGFFVIDRQKQTKERLASDAYFAVVDKVSQAKSYHETGQVMEASALLESSLQELASLEAQAAVGTDLKIKIEDLRAQIGQDINSFNKVVETDSLETVFDAKDTGLNPQRILRFNGEFYFFDPASKDIYYLNKNGEGKSVSGPINYDIALAGDESLLFFVQPNLFSYYSKGAFSKAIALKEPYAGYAYGDFYTYKQNLYLVDKNSGKIVKYPHLGGTSWAQPQIWLNADPAKLAGFSSMAFDKNAWILNSDGSIDKYYLGKLEVTLKPEYFPAPGQPVKIATTLEGSYLYVLDKDPARIIVLDKNGALVKQIKNSQLTDIRDIAVAEDGSGIWVLNKTTLYKVVTE